jgi:hypothetical protein
MSSRLATVAIGRLAGGTAWLGLQPHRAGWRVVFGGDAERPVAASADEQRELVLAAAGVYFEDALNDPPPNLEATHEDIAAIIGWLVQTEHDPDRRLRLREALDAVEDGLAVDEVIGRLLAAGAGDTNEPADWVDRLEDAYRSLSG